MSTFEHSKERLCSSPGIEAVPRGCVLTLIDPLDNHLNFTEWKAFPG